MVTQQLANLKRITHPHKITTATVSGAIEAVAAVGVLFFALVGQVNAFQCEFELLAPFVKRGNIPAGACVQLNAFLIMTLSSSSMQ